MSFEYPRNIIFSCNDCGICCGDTEKKIRRILLLSNDVNRIANFTKNNIKNFADEKPESFPYVFEMKKNMKTGKCIFHLGNKCSIYNIRPLICRFYPFELKRDEKGKYLFQSTQECPCVGEKTTNNSRNNVAKEFFDSLFKLARKEIG